MKTIKLKLGDSVELFNGTKGVITKINYENCNVEITGLCDYPQEFHKVNIKIINEIDIEKSNLEIIL